MEFSLSRTEVSRFEYRSEATSTNDVLKEQATADAAAWPDLSVIVTDNQTQGRGRLGRVWLSVTTTERSGQAAAFAVACSLSTSLVEAASERYSNRLTSVRLSENSIVATLSLA